MNCVAPGPHETSYLFGAETDNTLRWLAGQTILVDGGMVSPIN